MYNWYDNSCNYDDLYPKQGSRCYGWQNKNVKTGKKLTLPMFIDKFPQIKK